MTIGEAIFQGIVQGLTEFLPVSSSGHLSLIQYFTGQSGETGLYFTILLHLGTLLATIVAFYKTIWELILEVGRMAKDLVGKKFTFKDMSPQRRMICLLFVSLLPMIGSVFFLDLFDAVASDNDIVVEGVCFLITSFLLFASVGCIKGHRTAKDTSYKGAVAVGIAQAVAPMPGISRSGSTISVGLMAGMDREFAVSFSFIMGIPTVLGANLMQLGKAANEGMNLPGSVVCAGLLASLVFGFLAIKLVRWLVLSDKFNYFAWYTLVLGILTLGIGIIERLFGNPFQDIVMSVLHFANNNTLF